MQTILYIHLLIRSNNIFAIYLRQSWFSHRISSISIIITWIHVILKLLMYFEISCKNYCKYIFIIIGFNIGIIAKKNNCSLFHTYLYTYLMTSSNDSTGCSWLFSKYLEQMCRLLFFWHFWYKWTGNILPLWPIVHSFFVII
jgi:hypothetical protein